MPEWDRSMLSMSGAEYEVQQTLQAVRRLLATKDVRPTTRVVLEGAAMVLEGELEMREAARDH